MCSSRPASAASRPRSRAISRWCSAGPAAELRGGRSGARRLHLRDRARRPAGQDRSWRADRDGDARMLRAVAGGVARAGARRRRLHDRRGRGRGRGDEPPGAAGRRRSGDRRGRKRRRRACRGRSAPLRDPELRAALGLDRRVARLRGHHRRRDRSAALRRSSSARHRSPASVHERDAASIRNACSPASGSSAQLGRDADGRLTRLAGSDADKLGRDRLVAWITEAGLEVAVDRIGNIFGIWNADTRRGARHDRLAYRYGDRCRHL